MAKGRVSARGARTWLADPKHRGRLTELPELGAEDVSLMLAWSVIAATAADALKGVLYDGPNDDAAVELCAHDVG